MILTIYDSIGLDIYEYICKGPWIHVWSLLTCSSVWLWLVGPHESKREWRCESKGKQQQPLLQLWWITQSHDLFLWWQAGPVFQLHCRKCTASGTSLDTGKTDNIVIINLFFWSLNCSSASGFEQWLPLDTWDLETRVFVHGEMIKWQNASPAASSTVNVSSCAPTRGEHSRFTPFWHVTVWNTEQSLLMIVASPMVKKKQPVWCE